MLALADWPSQSLIGLLAAVLLIAAAAGIRAARLTHLPRVVGYLIAGIAIRTATTSLGGPLAPGSSLDHSFESALNLVKSLALCVILFEIGATFDRSHLRAARDHIWKLTLIEVTAVMLGVFVATWAVYALTRGDARTGVIVALLLAIAAIETAPAATTFVLGQYDAKGPLSEHILAMIGLNNILAVGLFYICFRMLAETGAIHAEHLQYGPVTGILLATVGSAAIGMLLGLALSFVHALLMRFENVLIFYGLMLALSVAAKPLGINNLVICLFMGLTFVNFSIQPGRLRSDLVALNGPIFALFFVIAGYSLNLAHVVHVGLVGIAYIALRSVGKVAGVMLGVRWIGPRYQLKPDMGTAMLCQAGIAIGLSKYVVEHWGTTRPDGIFQPDPAAATVSTIILASVMVFELIGPVLTRRAVVAAGEVKAITLLNQPGGSVRDARTVLVRLRHLIHPPKRTADGHVGDQLTARHVMRTNVEVLPESADLAEVLKFVERSRLHHFFVVDPQGRLVGTINFADLRNLVYNPMMARFFKAYDMANTAPLMVQAGQPLRKVLDLFHKHDVGSLPVVESEDNLRLLGIIEQRDVLRAMHVDEDREADDSDNH